MATIICILIFSSLEEICTTRPKTLENSKLIWLFIKTLEFNHSYLYIVQISMISDWWVDFLLIMSDVLFGQSERSNNVNLELFVYFSTYTLSVHACVMHYDKACKKLPAFMQYETLRKKTKRSSLTRPRFQIIRPNHSTAISFRVKIGQRVKNRF